MRVCAVIVTFNRKDELKKCIEANLCQTVPVSILVVDNASSDGTYNVVKEYEKNKHVKYMRLSTNLGGAGGFYYGMKAAFEKGWFDYVWLMDDDGRPKRNDALERLLDVAEALDTKEIILNSMVTSDENTLSFWLENERKIKKAIRKLSNGGLIREHINPFNGTLVSYETYKKIGLPRKEFFIKGDEYEYQLRALKNNIFIATCIESLFFHPAMHFHIKKFLNRNCYIYDEPYWKLYYRSRNELVILKSYGTRKQIFWYIAERLYSLQYYTGDRNRKFKYTICGLVDGFRNHFPRIKIK